MSEHIFQTEKLPLTQAGYLGPTPSPGSPPPRSERLWIDRSELLQQAVLVLKQSSVIAIDAEFTQIRLRTQGDAVSSTLRLAMLQLAIDRYCFVVDALRLSDLSPLGAVVSDSNVPVLLHGAGADIRVMAERGLNIVRYYDLEATSRSIFGQHESSLAAMLRRAFSMRLDKTLQRRDWTRRPLPPAMVAYAARDAEVTLALYYWLNQHYHDILQLHEYPGKREAVAAWIEPFLRGTATTSPDVAVAEALAQGVIRNKAQVQEDCRAALAALMPPMRRNRLLRLIADLALVQLAPDIEPLLHAMTSDERASSARTLGRLAIKSSAPLIRPLLQDAVQDVRQAAQTALRNLDDKKARHHYAPSVQGADGGRSWVVEDTPSASDDDDEWKARLRSLLRSDDA